MVATSPDGVALPATPTRSTLLVLQRQSKLPGVVARLPLAAEPAKGAALALRSASQKLAFAPASRVLMTGLRGRWMPNAVADFGQRTIGEKIIFSLDYGQNLAQGEAIASATWKLSLASGSDSLTPQNRVGAGNSTITGSVVSSPLIDFSTGSISSGSRYLIQCLAVTSLGETIVGVSHVSVQAPT
jgi:hypothetical protein